MLGERFVSLQALVLKAHQSFSSDVLTQLPHGPEQLAEQLVLYRSLQTNFKTPNCYERARQYNDVRLASLRGALRKKNANNPPLKYEYTVYRSYLANWAESKAECDPRSWPTSIYNILCALPMENVTTFQHYDGGAA